jgi:hypothetical protein
MRDNHGALHSQTLENAEKRSVRRQWECAVLVAAALAAASFAPHPIVLPIVSVVLMLLAASAAGYAWARSEGRHAGEFTRWDQAGILAFAGFVAALTGDSAEVLQFMESFSGPRLASE